MVSAPLRNLFDISFITLQEYFVSCMGKGTKEWLQHRNDLKQQYPRGIAPLAETAYKESSVRWRGGACGFCYRASEFCI